jgi:hypothetical protein
MLSDSVNIAVLTMQVNSVWELSELILEAAPFQAPKGEGISERQQNAEVGRPEFGEEAQDSVLSQGFFKKHRRPASRSVDLASFSIGQQLRC